MASQANKLMARNRRRTGRGVGLSFAFQNCWLFQRIPGERWEEENSAESRERGAGRKLIGNIGPVYSPPV